MCACAGAAAPRRASMAHTSPGAHARRHCMLPQDAPGVLHHNEAESGSYAERGLFVARCACTHASGCVLPAWRPVRVAQEQLCMLLFLHDEASEHGSHVVRCACTHIRSCLMSLWRHAYTSRSSCAPSLLRGDAARHSLLVARCARAGAEYLRAAPSPPRCREARFACHQVRRRTCEQLRACGHTPEQLPERNLCTYTGSAVRCLVSTAMMPSLARTTSAVCSLPGAHAHTRSVVCLCWRRGVMLTCTRAGVCWASSTRGMRAARTSQRRSQAGLARRRVRGGVHARRSRCALRLLQCGRARLARRQERTRFAHTRATVRLHYSAVCTHAGAAVRGFSSTTVLPT